MSIWPIATAWRVIAAAGRKIVSATGTLTIAPPSTIAAQTCRVHPARSRRPRCRVSPVRANDTAADHSSTSSTAKSWSTCL